MPKTPKTHRLTVLEAKLLLAVQKLLKRQIVVIRVVKK